MTEHRDQQIHFRVSKVELERIRQKMESCGILSIGSYLRKMALDGYCLNLDLPQLRRMAYLLQNCSNNLNQVAKRANESGQLYAADLEDLRSRLDELIAIGKQLLAKLIGTLKNSRSRRTAGLHNG
ncbi:MAG: plasmid mobilization protein [Faecalibacterium sp.]